MPHGASPPGDSLPAVSLINARMPALTLPVTAILVAHDSAAVIGEALASLARRRCGDRDRQCQPGTGARPSPRPPVRTVIRSAENVGFGAANNLALAAATTPYVLFLNPDATLDDGCIEGLVACAESQPDAALLVPTILKANGERFEKWASPICDPAFRGEATRRGGARHRLRQRRGDPGAPRGRGCPWRVRPRDLPLFRGR